MNILNKVTLRTLIKNKSRTIVTIIGIALSAALICSVTTAVASFYDAMIQDDIYKQGDWHQAHFMIDTESYRKVAFHEGTESALLTQELGYFARPGGSSDPDFHLLGTEGNFEVENMGIHILEGKYPASSSEIIFPSGFDEYYSIGDTITVDLCYRMADGEVVTDWRDRENEVMQYRETRTYTVVGFWDYTYWANYVLYSPTHTGFSAITLMDEGMSDDYYYNVYFKLKNPADAWSIEKDFDVNVYFSKDITTRIWQTNDHLLTLLGARNSDPINFVIYGISALAVLLVVFGSVSLIYNAFSISVSERTKQFGLLSSVGATKKQLRRTVLFEAFAVCVVGVPVGIGLGVGLVALGLTFLGSLFTAMGLHNSAVSLSVNPWALIIAAVIALLTALISAWIPSKRATGISAIEAIRQNKDISDKPVKVSKLTGRLFGLSGILASKYYKRSKKRYRATETSLVISIVLFVTAYAFGEYFLAAMFYNSNNYGYDLRSLFDDQMYSDSFTPDTLLEEYRQAEGITGAAYTNYGDPGYMAGRGSSNVITVGIKREYLTSTAIERETAIDFIYRNTEVQGDILYTGANITFVDDGTFKELLAEYGLNESEFMNTEKPLAVVLDGNRSYVDGRYIETRVLNNDRAEIIAYEYDVPEGMMINWDGIRFDEEGNYYVSFISQEALNEAAEGAAANTGASSEVMADKLTLNVGKVIYERPFFIDTSYASVNIIYPMSLAGDICAKWEGMTVHQYLILCDDYEKGYETVETINASHGSYSYIENYAGQQAEIRNTIKAVQGVAYAFVAMITLISIANVFNTINTNVNLRRREFAMLKSIGMTNGGLNGMMNFECLLYGSRAILYGLPVALAIVLAIYFVMSAGFDMPLYIPWAAIAIAVLGVFAVVFATMLYTMHNIKRANPIDELKNENI